MSDPSNAAASTQARVTQALEGLTTKLDRGAEGMLLVDLAREAVLEALTRLKQRAGFGQCTLVTAVDHYPDEPRFEVVWQLLSHTDKDRVRVRTRVPLADAVVPSASALWPGAGWSERECFDMFGIRFEGHPDLRRLLMPEGYDHHPLRKEFPHRGIEPDRLYREWDRERRAQDAAPR